MMMVMVMAVVAMMVADTYGALTVCQSCAYILCSSLQVIFYHGSCLFLLNYSFHSFLTIFP